MPEGPIKLEVDGSGYALLTLNRPLSLNALSAALCRTLSDSIDALAADPAVRVLILTGAGRAFCTGLDLKELEQGVPLSAFTGEFDPVRALGRFAGPVIGAVNGAAITGGFELALACDVLLAVPEACFSDTHARVGILPGWGLSQKLSRIVGPSRAKELAFSGNFMSAKEAVARGLVSRIVPAEGLLPEARCLAADMLSALPEMLPAYKRLIGDGYALPYGEALQLERERSARWGVQAAQEMNARRQALQRRGRHQAGTPEADRD
ncbi:enoyl-CoA hydratase [Noviherbaspirillum pedocola]|uniref:Enoyl-CoA hydratase n=1 Tax=Noviherbaspirillum pedocola TaxID=2801341 RepID=A0A934WAE0_9BURK|nr:enoyl-CoA hydratase [Noviherbaspirillum pedocola]MBK4738729.1 enoyl-CoA hydratase [Noviherbaspirillum pedocola]